MRTIKMIVILMITLGSLFIISTVQPAAQAETNMTLTLSQIWDSLNNTRDMVNSLTVKVDALTGNLRISNSNILFVKERMGYNDSDPSNYTMKGDFDQMYRALYTENGTRAFTVINANQVTLADKSDRLSGQLTAAEASIEIHTTDQVETLGSNIWIILIIAIITVFLVIVFMIVYVMHNRGIVRKDKGPAESLFVPQMTGSGGQRKAEDRYQQSQQAIDGMPECFRVQYSPVSNDCRSCAIRIECSGQQSPTKKYPIAAKKSK